MVKSLITINWDLLKSEDNNLYCYSICIQDGKIVRSRAYYYTKKLLQDNSKNAILDELTSSGLARCFSCGREVDKNYIKYDLHIYPVDSTKVYAIFRRIPFFELKKIHFFYKTSSSFGYKFFNRTIGAKVSTSNSIQNICIYFSNNEKINLFDCRFYLHKLCDELGLNENFRVPFYSSGCWLYIIAFDFSFTEFKLKFYIECGENFDQKDFLKIFVGSPSYDIVRDIVNLNMKIRGFQVAISNKKGISYNFYLCEAK